MKKIFIYYSFTGNGDIVASFLKEKGYDIKKIITKEPLSKNKVLAIMTGGFKALIGYKDKIEDLNIDLDKYHEILIGSPIWNSRISSPINTVLSELNLDNRNVNFILYSASGNATNALNKISKNYKKSKVIVLKEPKDNREEINKKLKNGLGS